MSDHMTGDYLFASIATNASHSGETAFVERECGFVDLNGDGIDDLLLSDPLCMDGNGGTTYHVILAEKEHYRHLGEITGNSIHVEEIPDETRVVWAFAHGSASSGSITCARIEYGKIFLKGSLPIFLTEKPADSLGAMFLDQIEKKATLPIRWKRSQTIDGKIKWD